MFARRLIFRPITASLRGSRHSPHLTIARPYSSMMYRASGQPPPVRDFAPENLKAWNIISNYPALPEREAIRAIHVYDFDNTLFLSPLPNTKVWHSPTLNNLQSPNWLANGGWWHDPRVLAATGDGLEVEEKRAWEGWWNEHIVALVKLSMEQKDALTVLLTGRSIKGFAPLIQRIVKSKGLEFDLVVLKPDILPDGKKAEHTIAFKCAFLEELLNTYSLAQELRCVTGIIFLPLAARIRISLRLGAGSTRIGPNMFATLKISRSNTSSPQTPSIVVRAWRRKLSKSPKSRVPSSPRSSWRRSKR